MRNLQVKNTVLNPNGSIDVFFVEQDIMPINIIIGNEGNISLPTGANHLRGIGEWIKEKLICNIIGHARHTLSEKGRYQPKHCYRCGKHIHNWR